MIGSLERSPFLRPAFLFFLYPATSRNRKALWYGEGKVIWNICLKRQCLSSDGMEKGETEGVERLSVYEAVIRVVQKISVERMANIFHMNPDLVGSPCLKGQKDEGTVFFRAVGQRFIVGAGVFPADRVDTPLYGGTVCAGNGSADRAGLLGFSRYSGQILAADLLFGHHFRENCRTEQMFGND